jgi:leucyl-tRNA synthetase
MMIFTNALQKAPQVNRATVLAFLQILAPFAPHLAEELWARVQGGSSATSVLAATWPQFDASKLTSREVKLVFQVNGKHRGDQLVSLGLGQEEAVAFARAHPRVTPHLEGRTVKRVIYVPGKILNIVAD